MEATSSTTARFRRGEILGRTQKDDDKIWERLERMVARFKRGGDGERKLRVRSKRERNDKEREKGEKKVRLFVKKKVPPFFGKSGVLISA